MFATGAFALLGLAFGGLDLGFAAAGWGWALAVALVSTVFAIGLFFVGATALGPVRASILSMLEPVVAVLASWLLLGGTLSWPQVAGGAVVLAGASWGVLASAPPQDRLTAASDALPDRRGSRTGRTRS